MKSQMNLYVQLLLWGGGGGDRILREKEGNQANGEGVAPITILFLIRSSLHPNLLYIYHAHSRVIRFSSLTTLNTLSSLGPLPVR